MNANAIIGFDRWTTDFSFAAGGGAWCSTYPIANLNVLPLSRVARSINADLTSTRFQVACAAARSVQLLAFVGHNASLSGQFRIWLYADTGLTDLLYDTGLLDFWPIAYPWGSLPWGHESFWTGKYTDREISGYNATRPVILDQSYLVGGIKVEVYDISNSAGYFQCGSFEIAEAYQLAVNFGYGAQYGFRYRSQRQEALGGVSYFERRAKPRIFRGSVDYMDRGGEALPRAFELFRRQDIDQPFLWLPHPGDATHFLRHSYLARLTDPGLISYASFGRDQVPLAFEEVL